MNSAINYEAKLQEQRTAVAVSGPIHCWEVGERKVDFWVRIVQGDVVGEARSENWEFDRMHEEWKVVVKLPPGKKFEKGPAYAEYWAKVQRASGPAMNFYWPVYPIRLR